MLWPIQRPTGYLSLYSYTYAVYVWPLASLWLEPLYCHWLWIWYFVVEAPVYLTRIVAPPS